MPQKVVFQRASMRAIRKDSKGKTKLVVEARVTILQSPSGAVHNAYPLSPTDKEMKPVKVVSSMRRHPGSRKQSKHKAVHPISPRDRLITRFLVCKFPHLALPAPGNVDRPEGPPSSSILPAPDEDEDDDYGWLDWDICKGISRQLLTTLDHAVTCLPVHLAAHRQTPHCLLQNPQANLGHRESTRTRLNLPRKVPRSPKSASQSLDWGV